VAGRRPGRAPGDARQGIATGGRRAYAIGPVIDGYSVQEAASVLGVPEGRVWELLARGVLSGTPEGDSMRVFLKAQPGPIATAGAGSHPEPPRTNGNGGSHGPNVEASAFRELLTEFRNLTERYGQALLALGEARGEVAGLRSRVDLLEARLDLRLPPARDEAPIAWEAAPPAPLAEVAARGAVSAPPVESPAPRTRRPRKARSSRAAVAGFAEALARAQDPAVAEVGAAPDAFVAVPEPLAADTSPPPDEAPAPVEGPQQSFEVAAPSAAPAVQAEAQATEDTPPESTYRAEVVEPDWFADGDFAWLDVAELEARITPAVAEAEAEPVAEAEAEAAAAVEDGPPLGTANGESSVEAVLPAVEAETTVAAPSAPAPEAEAAPEAPATSAINPEPEPGPTGPSTLEAVAMDAEPRPDAGPEPWSPAPEVEAPPVQPVAGEEELMWLGARHESATTGQFEMEAAAPRRRPAPVAAPEGLDHERTDARSAAKRSAVEPRPLALSEDELARLARDEGWDATEVAAIRAMIGSSPAQSIELPGAEELDVAMAAFDVAPIRPQADPSREWAKAAREREEPVVYEEWAYESEPSPPPATSQPLNLFQQPAARRPTSDPGWLRSRRGPAATAYRRLRRLFPG